MKLLSILSAAALALFGAASAASAATAIYDLSPLTVSTSPTSTGSVAKVADDNATGTSESFVSDFVFDIASLDSVGASADFTFSPGIGVSAYTLSLYAGSPTSGTATLVPTTAVTGVGQTSYDAILPVGDYFVQTDVTVPAYTTGKYDVQVVASAVSSAPEPAAWALMIAGVAMTGSLLRVRRNAGASLRLA